MRVMNSSVIQPRSRAGLAHARITSAKHVSTRTSYRLALWRMDRVTRRLSSGRMPRGFGDHQASTGSGVSTTIGKMPRRYGANDRRRLEVAAGDDEILIRPQRDWRKRPSAGADRQRRRGPVRHRRDSIAPALSELTAARESKGQALRFRLQPRHHRVAVKYAVITFGCRVNQADSLGFEEELLAAGASPAPPDAADLVIVNSCSVTATADQGVRQTVRRVARDNPAARIIVTGCYATRRPDEVRALPNVERVVPNDDKPRLIQIVLAGLRPMRQARADSASAPTYPRPTRSATATAAAAPHRTWRCRSNRVHAARANGMRRALFVLHHPDNQRRAAKPADRRRAA